MMLSGNEQSRRRGRARTNRAGLLVALATVVSSIVFTVASPTVHAASPPVARADVARTNPGAQVAVNVVGNDFDPDVDAVDVVAVSSPAHGAAFISGNDVYYTPDAGFSGEETFTYTIQDSTGLQATGTVSVWVDTSSSTTGRPVPHTDFFYVYQGSSVGFGAAQLLANDSDPENQVLAVVAVSEPSNNGTLTGDVAGGFTYVPASEAVLVGIDSQLNYLVTDTDGHVERGTITIRILAATDTNQAPVARADVARTGSGLQMSLNVVGNDFDPDGDSLSLVGVSNPAHGDAFISGNSVYYTPDTGFSGVETIGYTIRDGHGLTATGTLSVWVDTSNSSAGRPVPHTDFFYVYQGSSVGFGAAQLLANDSDPENQVLAVVAVSEPSNNGTLTGDVAGGFTYVPASEAVLVGIDSQLNYLVTDTDGHVEQGTITIRILAATDTNQAPVARADVARTGSGLQMSLNVVGNDFDPDGDSLSLVGVSNPAHGDAFISGNSVYYTPDTGFSGVETIGYTIRDGHGLTATGTLSVWVDTSNSSAGRPVPHTDFFYVYQGSSVGFGAAQLLANDSDPENQVLAVVAVSEPSNNGTLTGDVAGGFTYVPASEAVLVGIDSQLNYLVTDTDGHVERGTITIRILAATDTNQAPVARADVARTGSGLQMSLNVVGNDFDPDGDSLSLVGVSNPAHGDAFISGNSVYYTPDTGFSGVETIGYTIRDGHGLTATGTLSVWVDTSNSSDGAAGSAYGFLLRVSGFVGRVRGGAVVGQRQ